MATIRDIARESGFSVTTVSRALNGYSDVNEQSRLKIIETAKQLNYVPNKAAQNLVKKYSNTIAMIISGMEPKGGVDNLVYSLISGMYIMAEKFGYQVALFTMSSAYQKEKSYIQFCREHNIRGAVITGIRTDDKYFEEVVESDLPCVLIDIPLEGDNLSYIAIDNVEASREIVQILIDNNHKNIGMVSGRIEATVSLERYKGYEKALIENGIAINPDYVVTGNFLELKAYEVTKELLMKNKEITAIFCASDMMAIGCMKAVKELGLEIPKDISIVGFDDIPLAEYTTPPLTTVNQDFYERGKVAIQQLYKMTENLQYDKKINLDYKIMQRDSVRKID